jgi:myo-inositol catabolism protein IolS
MQTRLRLGQSPLEVQRVAFGCEQLGGHAWGAVDPAEITAAVEAALQSGPVLFDTADCYGKGASESRLGEALRATDDRALVATKFGVRFAGDGRVFYDNSREWAETALAGSLRRLRRERIDLYQVHFPDGRTPLESTFEWLERQRDAGRVRWYGISNASLTAAQIRAFPGLVSLSREYSLVNRASEEDIDIATAHGLTFIAYGVLAQGLLSGRYTDASQLSAGDRRQNERYGNFHGERLQRNLAIVEVLRRHATALGVTPARLAIAWVLGRRPRSVTLVGIKGTRQFLDAQAAQSLDIPPDTRDELEAASLVAS